MTLSYDDLLKRMYDLSFLIQPPLEGERVFEASSYDRASKYDYENDCYINWGANCDNNGIIRMEGDKAVVLDVKGPGVLWSFWSAAPKSGNIHIETEGTEKLSIPFRDFFEKFAYCPQRLDLPSNFPSLMPVLSRGRNRYIPIPFNKNCKVSFDPGWGDFYHIWYSVFPKGTRVPEYSLGLEIETEKSLALLDYKYATEMGYAEDFNYTDIINISLMPGEKKLVFSSDESGILKSIAVCLSPKEMENIWMSASWDDDCEDLNVLLSSLMGICGNSCPYKTLVSSASMTQAACFWHMPYSSCRIIFENRGNNTLKFNVMLLNEKTDTSGMMRFHAKTHNGDWKNLDKDRFREGGDRWPDWPLLCVRGRGRFCGVSLVVDNHWDEPELQADEWYYGFADNKTIDWWWGEGDEKFFVDGEKFPSVFGTGSEDYFGYAWAAEPPHINFCGMYSAQTCVPINGNGITALVRYHIFDNIPFQKSFEGFLEKYKDDTAGYVCRFTATPFWYEVKK